jgi:SAM-dependent methyltransferase
MPLCPRCRAAQVAFDAPACAQCGWRAEEVDGIPDFVAGRDAEAGVFRAYMELYEQIAGDDLDDSIQADELLELEAARLMAALGPVQGEAVCDVGIGRGFMFDRLRAAGPRLLVGVDLAWPYLRRAGMDGGPVKLMRANAENLPFRAELDAIVASDVLEHVLNPADFLQSSLEALAPGGRLLVKVPYRENISQYRRSDGCPYPMVHLRTFDRSLLGQVLEDAGLRVERFSYSGFYSGRWHPQLRRLPIVPTGLAIVLDRLYGENPGPNRIHPRIGRLLMRPVVITALARKPVAA